MPRLRNVQTGVTVSCSDELAEVLGSEWVDASDLESGPDAEAKAAAAKAPAKKAAVSKTEK